MRKTLLCRNSKKSAQLMAPKNHFPALRSENLFFPAKSGLGEFLLRFWELVLRIWKAEPWKLKIICFRVTVKKTISLPKNLTIAGDPVSSLGLREGGLFLTVFYHYPTFPAPPHPNWPKLIQTDPNWPKLTQTDPKIPENTWKYLEIPGNTWKTAGK